MTGFKSDGKAAAGFLVVGLGFAVLLYSITMAFVRIASFPTGDELRRTDVFELSERMLEYQKGNLQRRTLADAVRAAGSFLLVMALRKNHWAAVSAATACAGRILLTFDGIYELADGEAGVLFGVLYRMTEIGTSAATVFTVAVVLSAKPNGENRAVVLVMATGLLGAMTRFLLPQMIPPVESAPHSHAGMTQLLLGVTGLEIAVTAFIHFATAYQLRWPAAPILLTRADPSEPGPPPAPAG